MKRGNVVLVASLALMAAWVWFGLLPMRNTWLEYGRPVRVQVDVRNIELSLSKILSDAGQKSLRDLFDPIAFQKATTDYMAAHNANLFEASTALYTRVTYALLNHGRGALNLEASRGDKLLEPVQRALDPAVVNTLGTSYMTTLEDDPWGTAYQIFPGPWPDELGPVLLRTYWNTPKPYSLPNDIPTASDSLTVDIAGEDSQPQGFPASAIMEVYIWSLGRNKVSDQPRYDPTHAYAPPARSHYREDATDNYLGGGDDINNWDRDATFMLFYN